jgi:hypothetical protein
VRPLTWISDGDGHDEHRMVQPANGPAEGANVMKVNMRLMTARKVAQLLANCGSDDADLVQLHGTLQAYLDKAGPSVTHLTGHEWNALVWAAVRMEEQLKPYQDQTGSRFLIRMRELLHLAIPKAELWRDRTKELEQQMNGPVPAEGTDTDA